MTRQFFFLLKIFSYSWLSVTRGLGVWKQKSQYINSQRHCNYLLAPTVLFLRTENVMSCPFYFHGSINICFIFFPSSSASLLGGSFPSLRALFLTGTCDTHCHTLSDGVNSCGPLALFLLSVMALAPKRLRPWTWISQLVSSSEVLTFLSFWTSARVMHRKQINLMKTNWGNQHQTL